MLRSLRLGLVIFLVLSLVYSPAFAFITNPVKTTPTFQSPTNETVQKRDLPPHKDLPSPKDLLDEGKGSKEKTKAKETPLQPPSLCRFRDPNCLLKQLENGGRISTNTAAPSNQTQVASTAPKSEGNWLKRMGKKISGAFSGASALVNSPSPGHSLLPATAAAAPAPPPPPPSFATLNEAKLDPHTRVGTGGEDLFSGNYHWSTPLVNLPGRGGLDLNLSLHYNSLQWVRYGSTMYYDPDWRTSYPYGLATGFNMGFPEIETGYTYDGVTSYLVTLPSGYRVPMRRVYQFGTTLKYEAVDGSYLYLVVVGSTAPILYTPDGTQYTYGTTSSISSTKRCTQVRDSNGNRITIAYNGSGLLSTITDTLGRILNFSYTGYQLMQITQTWLGVAKVLVQFDYGTPLTLSYNFSAVPNLIIDGPASGSQISVLKRVITSDGARHEFEYNGWGLVDNVVRKGASDNQRVAADYVFPSSATALDDGPRFTQRNDGIWGFAGQWNDANGLGWVANYFDLDPNETYGRVATPDGVVQKELFSTTGNTRGLSTGMETWVGMTNWTGGVRRKWTATTWVSDGTLRPLYPRVTESNIYDDADGNNIADYQRRSTLEYWQFSAAGTMPYMVYLPKKTFEYAADAATVYRRSETDYLDNANYWSRWIIGLSVAQRLYDGAGVLQAQTTQTYDDYQTIAHATTINQHDTTNFGLGFYYRGNLTKTQRYSVVSGVASSPTETQAEYQVTGNIAKSRDALSHETKFFYEDAFATYADNAGNTETVTNLATKTYAYPTQVQDPDNFSTYVKYWYDTGAVTRTTDPKGAVAINLYENTYGRLAKSKNVANGAHTRYLYDTGHNWVQTWSTVNDATETAVLSLLDGAGRERQRVDEHPGSAGTLSSSYRVYDKMGRVVEWSNPTEINSTGWAPYGDDLVGINGPGTGGYIISKQTYDWNHRPLMTTNQDNTTRQISYTGCGCAGSAITTLTDEVGRQQKVYADFLGRTFKAETWQQINNAWSVYSTNLTSFNVRDQVTQSSLITGTNGASQNIDTQYDGYGRLWKRKSPLETTDTIYTYYNDDEIQQVKDARLAAVNYAYNARGLVTDITYDQPPNNPAPTDPLYVAPTQPVHFTYDVAGNRETMTDGIGSVTYAYDTLSRMQSEERTITEIGKTYSLTYGYNLSGQVNQVNFVSPSFPSDYVTMNYQMDKTGRLTGITGAPYAGGNIQYASQVQYRAFGAVKKLGYGTSHTSNATYNARLQVQSLDLKNASGTTLSNKTYSYYSNNRLKLASDLLNPNFDRAYEYDHAGRVTKSLTSVHAQQYAAGQTLGTATVPYQQNFSYDVWNNRLTNIGQIWGNPVNETDTYNAQTLKHDGWTYDNAGNVLNDSLTQLQYDVAGRNLSLTQGNSQATQAMDGDGLVVRQNPNTNVPHFFLNSSVLGGKVIAEVIGIDAPSVSLNFLKGMRLESNVYFGEARIATQAFYTPNGTAPNGDQYVAWQSRDPLTATKLNFSPTNPIAVDRAEPDSQAINVELVDPATLPPSSEPEPAESEEPGYCQNCGAPPNPAVWDPTKPTYYVNGIKVTERYALHLLSVNAATLNPNFMHDVSTLNWAGITGHWEKKPVYRPNSSDPTGISFFAGNGYDVVSSFVADVVQRDLIGLSLNQSKKSQQQTRIKRESKPKEDPNNPIVPDDAGRRCKYNDLTDVIIRSRLNRGTKSSLFGAIPHSWLAFNNKSVGWGPIERGRYGLGHVEDNSNPKDYPIDHQTRPLRACPETITLLEESIKNNSSGYYNYWNDLNAGAKSGYNCAGWACKMLENVGLKPPHKSSEKGLFPDHLNGSLILRR